MDNLRRCFRITDKGEESVQMRQLLAGDRFRLETDDEEDHIYGKDDVSYTALSNAAERGGVWGVSVQVA